MSLMGHECCMGATSQAQPQPRVVSSTDQPEVCQRRDGPRILVGPGEPGPGQQLRLAVVDARRHAKSVELYLMQPLRPRRWLLDRLRKLRRDKQRKRGRASTSASAQRTELGGL